MSTGDGVDRRPRRGRRWPVVVLLVVLVCVVIFSGLKIWQIRAVNSQAEDFYAALSAQATSGSGGVGMTVDWGLLEAENPRIVGWVHQGGTGVDYPVVAADDYGYYLTHLVDATVNPHGTPFVDVNSASDFSGVLTVVYGNDVSGPAMFGSFDAYRDQAYFDQHQFLELYTPQGGYRVALVYGVEVAAGQWRQGRAFMYGQNLSSLVSFAQANTTFTSQVEWSPDSRWVALATISATQGIDGPHYVLLGILEPLEG